MAVNTSLLTSGSSNVDATSYTTASITPSANKLILVAVMATRTLGTVAPTLTGNGLTWVQVQTQIFNQAPVTQASRITLFRSMGDNPAAGAITIDFGANTMENCAWSISEFGNVVITGADGADAIVQSARNSAAGVGSLTVSLAAFGNNDNATYGTFGTDTDTATTPGDGFTELDDILLTGEAGEQNLSLQTEWRTDNDTTVNASKAANADWGGVAIEIKEAHKNEWPVLHGKKFWGWRY